MITIRKKKFQFLLLYIRKTMKKKNTMKTFLTKVDAVYVGVEEIKEAY